jgi:hypothetical protein
VSATPRVQSEAVSGRFRLVSRLVWPLCALAVTGAVGVVVLDVLDRARVHSLHDARPAGIVLPVSFSLLGTIIVSRQPDNRVGWIFLLIVVLMAWESLSALYYERSVLSGGLPGGSWAAWTSNWVSALIFPAGLSLFAFLLFPSGRLPSARWRLVGWSAVVVSLLAIVPTWVDPSPISVFSGLPKAANPIGIAALGSGLTGWIGGVGYLLGMALITVTIGGLVVRARRADPRERQQVKLLAYAAALTIGFLILSFPASLAGLPIGSGWWDVGVVLGFGIAVPVACGVAILKHGLYEIDRLISRTLSYLLVTGLLAGVFVGIVVLGTDVLPFSSPVAVVASTLAAAALFNPLRLRVQHLVDRRFNRARYDVEATVTAFRLRLRDAVDLDTVQRELLRTVERAVEPAHTSLWIRPSGSGSHR